MNSFSFWKRAARGVGWGMRRGRRFLYKNFLKNAGESLENTKKEVTFASLLKWWM